MWASLAMVILACGVLVDQLHLNLELWALEQSTQVLTDTLASHRAMCARIAQGCQIEAASVCYFARHPGVQCRWYGGAGSETSLSWRGPPWYAGTMGRFLLRSGRYSAEVVLGLLGAVSVRWVDKKRCLN